MLEAGRSSNPRSGALHDGRRLRDPAVSPSPRARHCWMMLRRCPVAKRRRSVSVPRRRGTAPTGERHEVGQLGGMSAIVSDTRAVAHRWAISYRALDSRCASAMFFEDVLLRDLRREPGRRPALIALSLRSPAAEVLIELPRLGLRLGRSSLKRLTTGAIQPLPLLLQEPDRRFRGHRLVVRAPPSRVEVVDDDRCARERISSPLRPRDNPCRPSARGG